ncbi:hypothetical protein [Pedobacter sp.]|uniref:hypothetical protein n=1 Tax=Pedobacter sp. TaxID=1411316 RepID=UPI0031D07200
MKLENLYSLRKNFTVIGISGRVGSGCSAVAKRIADPNFVLNLELRKWGLNNDKPDDIKLRICYDYLKHKNNYLPFTIIEYKSVVFLHLLHEAVAETKEKVSAINKVCEIICQNGVNGKFGDKFKNRFDTSDDFSSIRTELEKDDLWFTTLIQLDDLKSKFKEKLNDPNFCKEFTSFFFDFLQKLAIDFFNLLNNIDITKRSRLLHDLSNNLRIYGSVKNLNTVANVELQNIYTTANTINRIIKCVRQSGSPTKIVIDSLKNSLELMYFKEKYSAFYMISVNREEEARKKYLNKKFKKQQEHVQELLNLDEAEYASNHFSKGMFASPDVENCIQKSEFHISNIDDAFIDKQLVKLLALIHQPGIVTPSAIERCMQIAYNAKLNSGCISRQVGAVITDANFSVKSVGWNDVAQHQLPCNLRNATHLINDISPNHFSDYEKNGSVKFGIGKEEKFLTLFKNDFESLNPDDLEGRNCSYCFKSFQNSYEGEKNQVHTRSLHAEENAMMQIVKYGGEGVIGGVLFTTASPCELCSKKAFQLGINKIYYIDPYPGIARQHILKNAVNREKNPKLFQFYGAVGRAFHKLYEPFMAYKDELAILSNISPSNPTVVKQNGIKKLREDKDIISEVNQDKYKEILKKHNDDELSALKEILEKGLS